MGHPNQVAVTSTTQRTLHPIGQVRIPSLDGRLLLKYLEQHHPIFPVDVTLIRNHASIIATAAL